MKKFLLPFVLLSAFNAFSQVIHIQEDFNSAALPAGWTTTAVTGNTAWSFGIDGSSFESGNNNLDSTSMAFFDDDALGSGQTNNKASLISPAFDNSNYQRTILEFDYNFDKVPSTVQDSLIIEVFDGLNWFMVKSMTIDDCGRWVSCIGSYPHAVIDISNYANSNCQVRFVYFDGNDWCFGAGIDNVVITSVVPFNIGAEELIEPQFCCGLDSNEQLTVKVMNEGTDTVKSFSIHANINNGAIILGDTVNATIAPFSTFNYTFNSSVDFSTIGLYNVMINTVLNLDTVNNNDTLRIVVENKQVLGVPFQDDFENNPSWTISGTNPSWELGTPSTFFLNSTTSGTNAFCTNLNGFYNANENSYLYSPCFDFSQIKGAPILQFNLNYFIEPRFDSLLFEYSIDNRLSWVKVEKEAISLNSYPMNGIWDGQSNGWITARNTLTTLIGESNVQFRFMFNSDITGQVEGVAIDDFEILESDSIDITLDVLGPDSTTFFPCGFGNQNIEVILANRGYTTVDSINLFYQVNGGAIVSELVTDSVSKYSTKLFNFSNSYDFSLAGTYNIKVWLQFAGDTLNKNDTASYQLIQRSTINNFFKDYYKEDFDSFVSSSCFNSARFYNNDTLKNGWKQISSGKFGWHVQNGFDCGGTLSVLTGPAVDHTSGRGNFMFTEASFSSVSSLDTAIIESPCIDFTNKTTAAMRFWYHRYGSDMGELYVDIYANGIWNLAVDSLVGQAQTSSNDAWKLKKVNFNQFAGQVIRLRFRGIYDGGGNGDMAIDDVEFYSPTSNDGRLVDAELLNSSCEFDTAAVRIVVDNFGTDSISANQLKVKYGLNGGQIYSDSNATIIPVDSTFVFTSGINGVYSSNSDEIIAWIELPNDSNQFNDTLKINFEPLNRVPEYIEGFENAISLVGQCGSYNTPLNLAWEAELNDQWVAGHDTICSYGSNGATPTSFTGPDSAYAGHGFMYFEPGFNSVVDTAVLKSTCLDFRNDSILYLDFFYHMYGASTGKLFIEINSFGNWIRLDSIIGQQHFAHSDPWSKKVVNLNQFSGEIVRIRFIAEESVGVNSDQGAIAIDEVRISNSFPVSLHEASFSSRVVLFPNPTNGEFTIRGNGLKGESINISLIDMQGRVIEKRTISNNSNGFSERFNLRGRSKGIYFVAIQSESGVEVKKLVLVKD